MYTFVTGYTKKYKPFFTWEEIDIASKPIASILKDYDEVYWVIKRPLYKDLRLLNLREIEIKYKLYSSLLLPQDFLNFLDYTVLETTEFNIPVNKEFVKYKDLIQAGYTVEPGDKLKPETTETDYREKPDLFIYKEGVDPYTLFKYSLFTVNGFLHRANYDGSRVAILKGAESGHIAKNYNLGIHSFLNIGRISARPFKIIRREKNIPLAEKFVLGLDVDQKLLKNKSLIVVIGGYPHLVDGEFIEYASLTSLTVNFKNYPHIQRILEMRNYINLYCLLKMLGKDKRNLSHWSIEELYSDTAIASVLTLPQSFYVIVDTPYLFLEKEAVEWSGLPGVFYTHKQPSSALYGNMGKLYEYWTHYEDGIFVLDTDVDIHKEYVFETLEWLQAESVDDARIIKRPIDFIKPFFYKLGTYVL